MKRSNQDVVGGPRGECGVRDVAGNGSGGGRQEVASYRFALGGRAELEALGQETEEAELQADFAEFLYGRDSVDGLPGPDPVFQERLRRQLWRTHVLSHLRDGGETH
jgi:hypothetical protein